jgi:hypothetical protein
MESIKSGSNNTSDNLLPVLLTPVAQLIAGVVDTGEKHKVVNISANFRKYSQKPQWDTLGPGGNPFLKKP